MVGRVIQEKMDKKVRQAAHQSSLLAAVAAQQQRRRSSCSRAESCTRWRDHKVGPGPLRVPFLKLGNGTSHPWNAGSACRRPLAGWQGY